MLHPWRHIALATLLVAATASQASADRRLVVAPFRGDIGVADKVRQDVTKALAREFSVVSSSEEDIDGVVVGNVVRRRSDMYLASIQLVEKRTGDRVKEISLKLRQPGLSSSDARQLIDSLQPAIVDLATGEAGADATVRPGQTETPQPDADDEVEDEDEVLVEEGFGEADDEDEVLVEDGFGEDERDRAESADAMKLDGEDDEVVGEGRSSEQSFLGSMPMDVIAGIDVFAGGEAGTTVADIIARGEFYPLTRRKSLLKHLGVVIDTNRTLGDDTMDTGAGAATEAVFGATTRQRFARGMFVVLAKVDAGLLSTSAAGETALSPVVQGRAAAGVEYKTVQLLAEVANFRVTGDSANDEFNLVPNVVLDWRLRFGGIHPFAVAVLPLRSDVRDYTGLIMQVGVRYEQ